MLGGRTNPLWLEGGRYHRASRQGIQMPASGQKRPSTFELPRPAKGFDLLDFYACFTDAVAMASMSRMIVLAISIMARV